MQESEATTLLREAALRVTRPRIAVLSAIDEIPHADVGTIVESARARLGAVSTQAVYDVLSALVETGLARRIDLPGSAARFERQKLDDHHHMVCRSCGAIADVELDPDDPGLHPTVSDGFVIESVEVTYLGRCPACQSLAQTARSGPGSVMDVSRSEELQL